MLPYANDETPTTSYIFYTELGTMRFWRRHRIKNKWNSVHVARFRAKLSDLQLVGKKNFVLLA